MIRDIFLSDLSLWTCLWQSTIFIALGLSAGYLLRRRPSRAYQGLLFAMIAAAAVPLMSTVVKHYNLGIFTASAPERPSIIPIGKSMASPFEQTDDMPDFGLASTDRQAPLDSAFTETATSEHSIPWRVVGLYGWLITTLVLLARLIVTFIYGACLVRDSQRSGCEQIQQAVDKVTSKLGLSYGLEGRSSSRVRSPVVWCWSRPSILLVPITCKEQRLDWSGVVAHELAHCKRLDHITGFIAELIVCLLPWNPLMWLSKKCLVRFGEQACDDWVVATGEPSEDYAESLLCFRPQKQMAFLPAVVHSKKGLAGRVNRILRDSCGNPRAGVTWALIVSILTACIAIGIACAQTRPAKPETPSSTTEKPIKSLQEASTDGDIEQVKLNLSIGADVNVKDNKGRTALHHAASNGHIEIAKLLIANGADVDARNQSKATPLQQAANSNRLEMAELLILKGADVNAEDESGQTPLSRAMHHKRGGREMVEFLVSKGAIVPSLHLAAYRGELDKIKQNLTDGANVDMRDEGGRTLLHYAASAGQAQVVELLIARGADVNSKDNRNESPLYYAVDAGWLNTTESLITHGADVNMQSVDKQTPLHESAYDGSIDIVKLLIAHGADINAKERFGYTPLHYTTWIKDPNVLAVSRLLLDKGADVNARTTWNGTPLTDAAESDNLPLAKLLVERGADVNAACVPYGCTCLHHAVASKEVVEFLIANGADVNAKNRNGQTPLHSAVREGSRDCVELLIAKGADIKAKNKWNQTPLYVACQRGNKEIVELLIEDNADIEHIVDERYGSTALHLAAVFGRKDIVEYLIEKGADVEARNSDGSSPLGLIAGYGTIYKSNPQLHNEIVELFIDKGANIESRSYWDCTPLYVAILVNRHDVAELLVNRGAKTDVINKFWGTIAHGAMRENLPDFVRWSIEKGVHIPPLHQAAYFGDIDKVKSLISEGADVNQKDIAEFTALHCATLGQNKEIAQLLIDNGANIEARNCGNRTPLYDLCHTGYLGMVKLLVENGANVNTTGNHRDESSSNGVADDWTPLHVAAHAGHAEVAEYLLTKGADTQAKCTRLGREGLTALHLAARHGHLNVVEVLLAKGADVNARTDKGSTALSLAKAQAQYLRPSEAENYNAIVQFLRKHGAKE